MLETISTTHWIDGDNTTWVLSCSPCASSFFRSSEFSPIKHQKAEDEGVRNSPGSSKEPESNVCLNGSIEMDRSLNRILMFWLNFGVAAVDI